MKNPDTPILFVDDDQTTHFLIRTLLEDWQIISAYSAEEALKIINKKHILIVISDIRMPGMDGISLLKEIRKQKGIVQTIIVTASHEIDDLISAFEAGASDFLLKPLDKEELIEAIQSAVSKLNRWKNRMKALFSKRKEKSPEEIIPFD